MALRARTCLISGVATALAAVIGFSFVFNSGTPVAAAEGGLPPSVVEDYIYPGAATILATKGIELKKGDGHILLADCDQAADQIRVLTVEDEAGRDGTYCFKATATTGYLTLSLPRVFALEATNHPISADLTANGATTTVTVDKGGFKPVGEGTVDGPRSVLVEIRVTG